MELHGATTLEPKFIFWKTLAHSVEKGMWFPMLWTTSLDMLDPEEHRIFLANVSDQVFMLMN